MIKEQEMKSHTLDKTKHPVRLHQTSGGHSWRSWRIEAYGTLAQRVSIEMKARNSPTENAFTLLEIGTWSDKRQMVKGQHDTTFSCPITIPQP